MTALMETSPCKCRLDEHYYLKRIEIEESFCLFVVYIMWGIKKGTIR